MNNSGDAAEQVVRFSLDAFEVVAKLSGTAAKEVALLLISIMKEEKKTSGKARLTNMLKSGKELKVFSIQQKDVKKFVEHAKKYGVLYCVLKDKDNGSPEAAVDIIARAEDASKIQRIVERFELGKVDKASIVESVVKEKTDREHEKENKIEHPWETVEPKEKPKEAAKQNPEKAKTDKSPLSEPYSTKVGRRSDKGKSKDKPSVKEKLDEYKHQFSKEKEAARSIQEPVEKSQETKPRQSVHRQPPRKRKKKVRGNEHD